MSYRSPYERPSVSEMFGQLNRDPAMNLLGENYTSFATEYPPQPSNAPIQGITDEEYEDFLAEITFCQDEPQDSKLYPQYLSEALFESHIWEEVATPASTSPSPSSSGRSTPFPGYTIPSSSTCSSPSVLPSTPRMSPSSSPARTPRRKNLKEPQSPTPNLRSPGSPGEPYNLRKRIGPRKSYTH